MPRPPADLAALILAAGAGTRYGTPKALACLAGRTWLELAAERAQQAGFAPILAVTGAEEERVRTAWRGLGGAADPAANRPPIEWVSNPDWPRGRTGSIQAGLCALAHRDDVGLAPQGVLIYPVDFPYVSVTTLRALARAFHETRAAERGIFLPVNHGRRGHPILVGWTVCTEITRLGPDESLRFVIHHDPERIREIVVADEGIHRNVNTRADERGVNMITNVLQAAMAAIERGEGFAMASIIEAEGSSPGKPGHKMIVYGDGRQEGTVGGGALENQVREEALTMLQRGAGGLLTYSFDADSTSDGMVCGGRAVVAVEVVKPPARILLCGAGHVSQALARQFEALGYTYTVVDERAELASAQRFPGAGALVHTSPASWVRGRELDGFSHVIVMTHDHALDQAILEGLAGQSFSAYVGLIGSRRKWATIRKALEDAGIAATWLDAVRCPIGLPIGGGSPAEIAVSITAQIIQELHA